MLICPRHDPFPEVIALNSSALGVQRQSRQIDIKQSFSPFVNIHDLGYI